MQDVTRSLVNRGNFNLLRDVLGGHVGKAVDAATCQQIARSLNHALPSAGITPQDVPALVRQFAASASALDDRRSSWNAKGPLATLMSQVTSGRIETPVSAVMRRASEGRSGLAQLAQALLAGPARTAKIALAAGLAATTLMAGVPAASFAQELGTTQGAATTSALELRSLDDVIGRFSDGQKVYVVGNLSTHGLDRLEQLLDRTAPHITVIAVERADRSEAELNRLVGRIAAQPAFQRRVNAATGESNGVIALVSFGGPSDRTMSWHTGDYYKKRGSGTFAQVSGAFTQGGPNATLYSRMRDVIEVMNQRATEYDQRVAMQATQALDGARADLSRAETRVHDVETRLATFTRTHRVDGDIARPPIAQWRAQLAGAQRGVVQGAAAATLTSARQISAQVLTAAETALAAMNEYESAPARMQAVQTKIERIAANAYAGTATSLLDTARTQLRDARSAHGVGSSRYEQILSAAATTVQSAEAATNAAEAEANRTTNMLVGGFAGLLLLGGIGFAIANLRRRTVRKESIARLNEVEAGLNGKLEKLIQAMKDADTYIGKDPEEARKRFDADTLKLAEQVIKDVGSLFVMQGAANEMREQAAALVKPNKFTAKLWNLVSKGSYNDALAMLKDRDITFSPDDGLTIIMEGDLGSKSWKDALVSDLKSFKPFAMSFEKLMETFEATATRLSGNFSTIRDAQQNAKRRIEEVAAEGPALKTVLDSLAAKASVDGLFTLPSVATVVLPDAERFLQAARTQLDRNPVGAEKGGGASANRLLDDGAELANACVLARDIIMPQLVTAREALAKDEVAVAWIGKDTKSLSERATAIADKIDDAKSASDTTAHQAIVALRADIEALGQRAQQAVSLNTQRLGESAQALSSTITVIEAARAELGKALKLDPDKVLAESELDPSALIARATKSHSTSKTQLDAGDVKGAAESLRSVATDVAAAKALVEEAKTSVRNNAERVKTRGEAIATLEGEGRTAIALLETLRGTYAAPLLESFAPAERDFNTAVAKAKSALTAAQKEFAAGAVIAAGRGLASIGEIVSNEQEALRSIGAAASTLRQQDANNEEAARHGANEAADASRLANDGRTRSTAAEAVSAAVAQLHSAVRASMATGRDPKRAGEAIQDAREAIAAARASVVDDHSAHDLAAAAIITATAARQEASSYSDGGYYASRFGDGGAASLTQAALLMATRNYEAALAAAVAAKDTAEANMASAHSAAESDRQAAAEAQRKADEAAAAARAPDPDPTPSVTVDINPSSNDDVTSGKF